MSAPGGAHRSMADGMGPNAAPGAAHPYTTVAARPPWSPPDRPRPTWGLAEGDEIAPGRTVLQRLGGGSRYDVYLVWDDHLLAVMVAKLLRPDQAANTGALRDLTREAGALSALAHPVLVRCFDVELEGRHPHLLIEHLEGPTLHELIAAGSPLALEQLLPLAMHTAAALHYMAAEGWVHLDVKPDNIVMGAPPRLIDLSVARTLERARRLVLAVGTDAYMAPEQCAPGRPATVGPAADVFGLGATLFHALAGRVPFDRPDGARESADPKVRWPQLVHAPGALARRVPAELGALVERCLARDPSARPAAKEVVAALEPLVARLSR
jgi:eukaryotic-like serine/threonine-protein kinase